MLAVLVSRSMSPAWKSAIGLAFGFSLSRLIIVVVLAFGLGLWFTKNPDILFLAKALGACYLVWLAIGMWIGTSNTTAVDQSQGRWLASVGTGIAIGLSNPATCLIYMVLLQIVAPTGFTGLGHIGFACLVTFASVGVVYLGTVLIARRLCIIVVSSSSRKFCGRVTAATLAMTSVWLLAA
jgi:threonine/homoserine/homoserine lactone efflux protein